MERHHTSREDQQLHLPLPSVADNRGPEEVVLPFTPDKSIAFGTEPLREEVSGRVRGSVSRREATVRFDETVIDARTGAFTTKVDHHITFLVVGNVVSTRVQDPSEAHADVWNTIKAVRILAVYRHINGEYEEHASSAETKPVRNAVEKALLEHAVEDFSHALAA